MSRASLLAALPLACLACLVAAGLVACGGDGGGPPVVDGPFDARAGADASADAAVPDGPLPDASDVAAGLDGLRWELPCLVEVSNYLCDTVAVEVTSTLGGVPGTTYEIALRLRGVIEQKTYENGVADGSWYVGGNPIDEPYNVYKLEISNPPQVYFINAGTSGNGYCDPIDYTRTITGTAGATITLSADPIDVTQIKNVMNGSDTPHVVADIPPAPLAYDGQFVQMDVVSVTPVP